MRFLSFALCVSLIAVTAAVDGRTASTGTNSVPVASSPENAVKIVEEQTKEEKKRLKIAIFAPRMANSQVIWNKRVGEELMKAGHDVTIYMMQMYELTNPKVDIDPRVRVVSVNGSFGLDGEKMMQEQAEFAFNDMPFWDSRLRATMGRFIEMGPKSCALFVKNKEFIADVENSKYDIAFTHMYNSCPIGIIHKTKIPTWVWLISGALMDNVAELMGVPVPPSYCVPSMMDSGEKMTFIQRVKAFTGHTIFKFIWRRMTADKEREVFRAEFGDDFPDIVDLAAKAPLVMVNSNELYDFARPTLAKIVNIGGVGIKSRVDR